jgi:hypothetical protein
MQFTRDSKALKGLTELLRDSDQKFTIKHGTYTTYVETDYGKRKFQTHNFHDRVFIASKMIRRDVISCENGKLIMSRQHGKTNFGHREKLSPFQASQVLNIDISSAYATCLYLSCLITEKTYEYLKSLRKEERLPAIGMLARASTIFQYEGGKCVSIDYDRADTSQVFFYLIEEINLIMQSIAWELGKYYYFHWVDGVFFSVDTPKQLISRVEEILIDRGYRFKYEKVTDFSLSKNKKDLFTINMKKNGEHKTYQFHKTNNGDEVKRFLMLAANEKR